MIRLAVIGATGRMGQRVLSLAAAEAGMEVAAAITAQDDPWLRQSVSLGRRSLTLTADTQEPFDVAVDFSSPQGTVEWCRKSFERGAAFVSGTTGLSAEQMLVLHLAAERVPVLWAPNFSPAVYALMHLAGEAAKALNEGYEIEIVEAHHDRKVDSPSGTALSLVQAVAEARGLDAEKDVVYGRRGAVGPRPQRQIGVHSLRLGDEVGRHEVHFGGAGETLILSHAAHSRDAMVRGALQAARWIAGRPAGLYSLDDVFGPKR